MPGKMFRILFAPWLVIVFAATPQSHTQETREQARIRATESQVRIVSDVEAVSIIVVLEESVDPSRLEEATGGRIVHRYRTFNGASLVLPGEQIETVAKIDGVTGVFLDELLQLETEVSPAFIGAPTLWNRLGGQGSAGEGVVVGVLDTGIWPEHPSYSDPDPFGNPYPPPAVLPGANGFGSGGPRSTCEFGNAAWNPHDAPFACNNKLIGAYQFLDTYKAVIGLLPTEFDSARDDNGHGTHTSSTAAGNGGVTAELFGVTRGIVSGIAPRAHVIAYRVCADQGCFQSDSVAAIEQAILDGVDTINFSISGGGDPYTDLVSLAFLNAYDGGVFVAASAGNSGPGPNTVAHREPWTTTVGASTTGRHFISTVNLRADNNDVLQVQGASVTGGIGTPTPVVFPPAGQELCLTPFAPGTFSGEIVVCERGVIARVAKSFNVAAGGAGGLLLYNPTLQGLATDSHFIPSVHLENDAGQELLDFMSSHTGVIGTFTPGLAMAVPGDTMAAFSSRGGTGQSLGISKPDVTAPGVQILAGHTPLPATIVGGPPGELFQAIQGTSMSSPHVAGAAALLKALHPEWSAGQIKSALMMTATGEVTKEDGVTAADPFDHGSGRVDLARAGDPGLTISATAQDFVDLQDQLWNANYPSLYVPVMTGLITVERTVHSELDKNSVWKTAVRSPPDVTVSVPRTIQVGAGEDATLPITIDAGRLPEGEVRHATLYLSWKSMDLRFPITVVRGQPAVTLEKSCSPLVVGRNEEIDCTITATNTSFQPAQVHIEDDPPPGLPLVVGSVSGATQVGADRLFFDGSLFAASPPEVEVTTGTLSGYVPLAPFGIPPSPCPSNCDDGGFLVSGLDIHYLGQHYTSAIWSVNGTLELGTASGIASPGTNQNLPNPVLPNNVLAPWWTDLDLGAGGNWYIGSLTDGVRVWTIFEWANVPRFGDLSSTFSFQIWLERGTQNITFAYGPFAGSTTDGTTGAENAEGTFGDTYYFDGNGILPWDGDDLSVLSVPGAPGGTHVITFRMHGEVSGKWTNCAEMTSDQFQGTNVSCTSGEVSSSSAASRQRLGSPR